MNRAPLGWALLHLPYGLRSRQPTQQTTWATRQGANIRLQSGPKFIDIADARLQLSKLAGQEPHETGHRVRQTCFLHTGQQPQYVSRPLGLDEAELGKMAADRIEQLGALADGQVTRPMQHQGRLLVLALDRTKRIKGRVTDSQMARCMPQGRPPVSARKYRG